MVNVQGSKKPNYQVSGNYLTNMKACLKAVHGLIYDAVEQKEAANYMV